MADSPPLPLGFLQGAQIVYELEDADTCIGRSEENDIVLRNSRSISGLHARLHINPAVRRGAQLMDLNSLNGCFVNDVRYQNAAVRLKSGDYIRFGYDTESYRFFYPEDIPATLLGLEGDEAEEFESQQRALRAAAEDKMAVSSPSRSSAGQRSPASGGRSRPSQSPWRDATSPSRGGRSSAKTEGAGGSIGSPQGFQLSADSGSQRSAAAASRYSSSQRQAGGSRGAAGGGEDWASVGRASVYEEGGDRAGSSSSSAGARHRLLDGGSYDAPRSGSAGRRSAALSREGVLQSSSSSNNSSSRPRSAPPGQRGGVGAGSKAGVAAQLGASAGASSMSRPQSPPLKTRDNLNKAATVGGSGSADKQHQPLMRRSGRLASGTKGSGDAASAAASGPLPSSKGSSSSSAKERSSTAGVPPWKQPKSFDADGQLLDAEGSPLGGSSRAGNVIMAPGSRPGKLRADLGASAAGIAGRRREQGDGTAALDDEKDDDAWGEASPSGKVRHRRPGSAGAGSRGSSSGLHRGRLGAENEYSGLQEGADSEGQDSRAADGAAAERKAAGAAVPSSSSSKNSVRSGRDSQEASIRSLHSAKQSHQEEAEEEEEDGSQLNSSLQAEEDSLDGAAAEEQEDVAAADRPDVTASRGRRGIPAASPAGTTFKQSRTSSANKQPSKQEGIAPASSKARRNQAPYAGSDSEGGLEEQQQGRGVPLRRAPSPPAGVPRSESEADDFSASTRSQGRRLQSSRDADIASPVASRRGQASRAAAGQESGSGGGTGASKPLQSQFQSRAPKEVQEEGSFGKAPSSLSQASIAADDEELGGGAAEGEEEDERRQEEQEEEEQQAEEEQDAAQEEEEAEQEQGEEGDYVAAKKAQPSSAQAASALANAWGQRKPPRAAQKQQAKPKQQISGQAQRWQQQPSSIASRSSRSVAGSTLDGQSSAVSGTAAGTVEEAFDELASHSSSIAGDGDGSQLDYYPSESGSAAQPTPPGQREGALQQKSSRQRPQQQKMSAPPYAGHRDASITPEGSQQAPSYDSDAGGGSLQTNLLPQQQRQQERGRYQQQQQQPARHPGSYGGSTRAGPSTVTAADESFTAVSAGAEEEGSHRSEPFDGASRGRSVSPTRPAAQKGAAASVQSPGRRAVSAEHAAGGKASTTGQGMVPAAEHQALKAELEHMARVVGALRKHVTISDQDLKESAAEIAWEKRPPLPTDPQERCKHAAALTLLTSLSSAVRRRLKGAWNSWLLGIGAPHLLEKGSAGQRRGPGRGRRAGSPSPADNYPNVGPQSNSHAAAEYQQRLQHPQPFLDAGRDAAEEQQGRQQMLSQQYMQAPLLQQDVRSSAPAAAMPSLPPTTAERLGILHHPLQEQPLQQQQQQQQQEGQAQQHFFPQQPQQQQQQQEQYFPPSQQQGQQQQYSYSAGEAQAPSSLPSNPLGQSYVGFLPGHAASSPPRGFAGSSVVSSSDGGSTAATERARCMSPPGPSHERGAMASTASSRARSVQRPYDQTLSSSLKLGGSSSSEGLPPLISTIQGGVGETSLRRGGSRPLSAGASLTGSGAADTAGLHHHHQHQHSHGPGAGGGSLAASSPPHVHPRPHSASAVLSGSTHPLASDAHHQQTQQYRQATATFPAAGGTLQGVSTTAGTAGQLQQQGQAAAAQTSMGMTPAAGAAGEAPAAGSTAGGLFTSTATGAMVSSTAELDRSMALLSQLPSQGGMRDLAVRALLSTREEQVRRLVGSADEPILQLAAAASGATLMANGQTQPASQTAPPADANAAKATGKAGDGKPAGKDGSKKRSLSKDKSSAGFRDWLNTARSGSSFFDAHMASLRRKRLGQSEDDEILGGAAASAAAAPALGEEEGEEEGGTAAAPERELGRAELLLQEATFEEARGGLLAGPSSAAFGLGSASPAAARGRFAGGGRSLPGSPSRFAANEPGLAGDPLLNARARASSSRAAVLLGSPSGRRGGPAAEGREGSSSFAPLSLNGSAATDPKLVAALRLLEGGGSESRKHQQQNGVSFSDRLPSIRSSNNSSRPSSASSEGRGAFEGLAAANSENQKLRLPPVPSVSRLSSLTAGLPPPSGKPLSSLAGNGFLGGGLRALAGGGGGGSGGGSGGSGGAMPLASASRMGPTSSNKASMMAAASAAAAASAQASAGAAQSRMQALLSAGNPTAAAALQASGFDGAGGMRRLQSRGSTGGMPFSGLQPLSGSGAGLGGGGGGGGGGQHALDGFRSGGLGGMAGPLMGAGRPVLVAAVGGASGGFGGFRAALAGF